MLFKIKFVPVVFLFTISCGESTAFKETELGRFEITVAGENNPTGPSADGTVPLEKILIAPATEGSEGGSQSERTQASKVEAALAETTSQGAGSVNGSDAGKGQQSHSGKSSYSAGPTASSQGSTDVSDEQTMQLCSNLFQGKAKYIKLIRSTDSASAIQANSETVIAVRLSGNQTKFGLNVGGSQKLAGLCIVAVGNMPTTDISSSVNMGQIVYVGRGNQSQASFAFSNATLDTAYVNLKGNSHLVSFDGVGASVCSSLDQNQGKSTIDCN